MFELPKVEDLGKRAMTSKEWERVNRLAVMTISDFAFYSMGSNTEIIHDDKTNAVFPWNNYSERVEVLQNHAKAGELGEAYGSDREPEYSILGLAKFARAKKWELPSQLLNIMLRAESEARNERYIKSQTDKAPIRFDDGTTSLEEYLELDTWTPEQAACLVAGIKPETMSYLAERPNDIAYQEAESLSGMRLRGGNACTENLEICYEGMASFETRMRVLKLWNSQNNPPAKVAPSDFVVWCKSKNIDAKWLNEVDAHSGQNATAATMEAAPVTMPQGNKLRRDILDPAIDKAIANAGNMKAADVYLKLKELAKVEEPPFTGSFEGDAMFYTNANDKSAKLSKEALGKRLERRANKAATN